MSGGPAEQRRREALAELAVGRAPAAGPDDADPLFDGLVRAVAAANAGNADRARAEADRLRDRYPDRAPVHHLRALLDLAGDRPADALAAARRALDRDPRDRVALALTVRAGLRAGGPAGPRAAAAAGDALAGGPASAAELTAAALAALAAGDSGVAEERLRRASADGGDPSSELADRVRAELLAAAGEVAAAADRLEEHPWTGSRLRARELVGRYERFHLARFGVLLTVPMMVHAVLLDGLPVAGFAAFGVLVWVLTLARAPSPWRRVRYYFAGPDQDNPGGPFVEALLMPVVLIGGTMAGVGVGNLWLAWAPAVHPYAALSLTVLLLLGVDRLLVHRPWRRRRAVVADLAALL